MKVLVLQNSEQSPSGFLGESIAAAGGVEDVRSLERGDALPDDPAGHDALLVLGGAQHAADDAAHPYLGDELGLIRAFAAAGKPVLGVCLGSQLLARAFGGAVRRHHTPEFGFTEIAACGPAADDPLLAGLAPLPRLMHWHSDTFDLPEGAVRLATNPICENQAFTLGRGLYGLQFHLEVTPAILGAWVEAYPDWIREKAPAFYAGWTEESARHMPAAARFARAVGDRWAAMARRPG